MIKTAVIGASGYVGRHLWKAYRSRFPDCVGTTFSAEHPQLKRFDIREPGLEAAYAVNVKGTLELARQVGCTRMQVIFLSSDYVFGGEAGPHDDDHPVRPTTEYGRHKAQVERELPSLAANHLVLRLSKIYGVQKGDRTLLDEMAALLAGGKEIRAAYNQVFCPTNVGDLVRVVRQIQDNGLQGIVNACNPERWSRFDIALALAKAMQAERSLVKPISLYDIPAMAGRPLDTSMKSSRLASALQPRFVPLGDDIERVAALWKAQA